MKLTLPWAGAEDPRPPDAAATRTKRILGMAFAGLWLWPLLGTYATILRGDIPRPWVAGTVLTVYIAIYLGIVAVAFSRQELRPSLREQALLVSLGFTGLGFAALYPHQPVSGGLTVYMAAASAAVYPMPTVLWWVAGALGTQIALGVATHQPTAEIAETAFSTLLATALVLIMRRLFSMLRELRETRAALAAAAVEQERLRFARDLHDLLGHTLSLIVVKSEVAKRMHDRDPALALKETTEIETLAREALSEVRRTVSGYRMRDFGNELISAKAALADSGISSVVRTCDDPLPTELNDAFAWVVREAVTNVIRHSGASSCVIALTHTGEWVLEIRDDGRGGVGEGNGLRGLGERMSAVDGSLTTVSDGGFTLRATAP